MKKKDKEAGEKARAGVLLSSFIRSISQEETVIENEDGTPKKVMKAEALARQIWDRALGTYRYVEELTGKIKRPLPDRSMIDLIFNRMEGTAGTLDDTKKRHESLPDKMSRQNKERVNKLAAEGD